MLPVGGASITTESGIKSFRGEGGLYEEKIGTNDTVSIVCPCLLITVSIHALRGESDDRIRAMSDEELAFQSTLPVRGATGNRFWCDFVRSISIHALREESDPEKEEDT